MRNRLKKRLWLAPLLLAGLVAVFGWWGSHRLQDTIEDQVKAQLNATLAANVTALEIWTTNQMRLATLLASEPLVRSAGEHILEDQPAAGADGRPGPDAARFGGYLRPRLIQLGYETAELVDTNFTVGASTGRIRVPLGAPIMDAQTNKFAELFASGDPVMITPFKPELFVRRRAFRAAFGAAETNEFRRFRRYASPVAARGRSGDQTLMQVAAPLRGTNGVICGALALIVNPDTEFSKILTVARSGDSGETYAFDQTGLMISNSRFDDQLHQLGLLSATNASAALYVRLHDPGGDLTAGYQPAEERAEQPLTRLVADAVDGIDGVDVTPSRDYRGVPVVGAWRWLPQLGFGVATQIDADEAYRPLRMVRLLFIILLLLLVLCALGMLLFSYVSVISRRRLTEAELKLKQLGQYTLEEKIGEGGMGVVYRARHALMRRDTAVKLLLPDRADPAAIERFEREVRLTCQLTHPNTIQVYDYGHTPEGIFYYVMEYLRGLNLHDFIARFGPPPEARVIHILTQVCDSLAEAHALGLIHRDIKPGNIFLCDRGGIPDCVKVLDFGLVQEYRAESRQQMNLEGQGALEGTPWFMPPEAIKNSTASDPRSDIYSVGALAYYLLTGAYAYDGATVREIHDKQLAGPPPAPGERTGQPVSRELARLVLACLAARPEDRPQSALELREQLLATPRAGEWTVREQAEWWAQFHQQPLLARIVVNGDVRTPMATVKIDINTRLP
jgi:hypothetical protein